MTLLFLSDLSTRLSLEKFSKSTVFKTFFSGLLLFSLLSSLTVSLDSIFGCAGSFGFSLIGSFFFLLIVTLEPERFTISFSFCKFELIGFPTIEIFILFASSKEILLD